MFYLCVDHINVYTSPVKKATTGQEILKTTVEPLQTPGGSNLKVFLSLVDSFFIQYKN